MNILLVDDDRYVVEVLWQSLDWERLSIGQVFRASSVGEAKKILEENPVHILVCDIEMPKEDGFSLIRWIREKEIPMKEIMLTSYAEFEYANEAVNLNCFAYALKPIDFEHLEEIIAKAVCEEEKALSEIAIRKQWNESREERSQSFWKDCLAEGYEGREEEAAAKMKEYGLTYTQKSIFILAYIEYTGMEEEAAGREKVEKNLRRILSDEYTDAFLNVESFFRVSKSAFLAVLGRKGLAGADTYRRASREVIRQAGEELAVNISIIMTYAHHLSSIVKVAQRFLDICENSVCRENEVSSIHTLTYQQPEYIRPDLESWEKMILEGRKRDMADALDNYLDIVGGQEMIAAPDLYHFASDYLQLLIGCLQKKEKLRYDLDSPFFTVDHMYRYMRFYSKARKCFGEMLEMVFKIMGLASGPESAEESIVKKVRAYIDENLDKELGRESIADMVYLNQDYLSRMFKKETGESLGAYISSRRIRAAADYLAHTAEPINSVAGKVGFDNFSYFSKVFKTATGHTPKEYRQVCQEGRGEQQRS